MTREEIIQKLAGKFGPHVEMVTHPPDEDHRHRWTSLAPDGRDELATTLIAEQDDDPEIGMSIRALTYGEIADALLGE